VTAVVPFDLDGTVPPRGEVEDIGDDGDGFFAYRVFTTEFGLTTCEVESRLLPPGEEPAPGPTPVPLPPALEAAMAAVATLCVAYLLAGRNRIRRAC
jgi:hypothetical protein